MRPWELASVVSCGGGAVSRGAVKRGRAWIFFLFAVWSGLKLVVEVCKFGRGKLENRKDLGRKISTTARPHGV